MTRSSLPFKVTGLFLVLLGTIACSEGVPKFTDTNRLQNLKPDSSNIQLSSTTTSFHVKGACESDVSNFEVKIENVSSDWEDLSGYINSPPIIDCRSKNRFQIEFLDLNALTGSTLDTSTSTSINIELRGGTSPGEFTSPVTIKVRYLPPTSGAHPKYVINSGVHFSSSPSFQNRALTSHIEYERTSSSNFEIRDVSSILNQ